MERVNRYVRAARAFYNLNRWIAFRIDLLGGIFSGIVAAYLVYGLDASAGRVGFALSVVLSFAGEVLYCVRFWNMAEVECEFLLFFFSFDG